MSHTPFLSSDALLKFLSLSSANPPVTSTSAAHLSTDAAASSAAPVISTSAVQLKSDAAASSAFSPPIDPGHWPSPQPGKVTAG